MRDIFIVYLERVFHMGILATFLGGIINSPDPEPASPTSAAVAVSKKDAHNVLTAHNIPPLSYSFGVDHNSTINDFFQHYLGTEHEYAIREIVTWINEGMHSSLYGNRMCATLKSIIETEDKEDKVGAAKRKMIYTIVTQHAHKSSPIDDNWTTQEIIMEPTGIISIEIVKGTHESDAFISSVTNRKYPLFAAEMLYVIHLEHMPYESHDGEDNTHINHAHQWLRKTLTELQQKYAVRYMIVCSPFVDSLYKKEDIYTLRQEFQENTRMYRTLLASSDLFAQEEQALRSKISSIGDEDEKRESERQLKRYEHYKVLLAKKDAIKLGMKKVDEFLHD